MDERERKAHISRRLKAARWLAGDTDEKGSPRPLSPAELVKRDAMIDYGITRNRVEEIEQCKARATRGDLEALIDALELPDDWFAGLYPAEALRGEVNPDSLGAALLALAAGVRAHRQESQDPDGTSDGEDHRDPGQGAHGG